MEYDIFTESEENTSYLNRQLITYIGNKRKLLGLIKEGIERVCSRLNKEKLTIFDGFSGSGVTSRFFKKFSQVLHVNDLEHYSFILNKCFLSNQSSIDIDEMEAHIQELNHFKNRKDFPPGIIEKLYSPIEDNNIQEGERVFYTRINARIIDNIRRSINLLNLPNNHLYLAPLLIKASIHTNTSGVFKGFYKDSEGKGCFGGQDRNCLTRIRQEISLSPAIFSNFECETKIWQRDTNALVKEIGEVDVAYYDPPYNQHPYGSNYFMLNIISDYRKPEGLSKVSGIPSDWNKSVYNDREDAEVFFNDLINNTQASVILMSLRRNAPYADRIEENGKLLIYEGHDIPNIKNGENPKIEDQSMYNYSGSLTQNGLFYKAAQKYKKNISKAEFVKVYEKIRSGIWVYNGLFRLVDSCLENDNNRKVFKFKLELT